VLDQILTVNIREKFPYFWQGEGGKNFLKYVTVFCFLNSRKKYQRGRGTQRVNSTSLKSGFINFLAKY